MRRFQPRSITIAGAVAFVIWAWFGMSNMDYHQASPSDGRETAGWFMLGIPLLLPFALLSTMPFSMIARRGKPLAAWFVMLTIFTSLIWLAWIQSTPQARLAWAMGIDLPPGTSILRLRQIDSFNDGPTVWGAFKADRKTVQTIVERHTLSLDVTGDFLHPYMPDAAIPEDGFGYRNEFMTCYYDEAHKTLYFFRRFSSAQSEVSSPGILSSLGLLSTPERVVRHHEPWNQRKLSVRTRVSRKDTVMCA